MKKIIPTICMSLLGLSAIATSSYAWFSMNKTVTASGMQVKARAEGGIQIKRAALGDNAYGTSADSSHTAVELLPTSTADGTKWYHAEGASGTASTAISGSYQELTLKETGGDSTGSGIAGIEGTMNYYYVFDNYTISSDKNSGNFVGLWVAQAYVDTSTQALSKSLRIGFFTTDKAIIVAPNAGFTATYNVNGETSVTALDYSTSGTTAVEKDNDGKNVLVGDTGASSVNVKVCIWFEGEDENHFTNNIAQTLETMKITVTFKATSVQAKESA